MRDGKGKEGNVAHSRKFSELGAYDRNHIPWVSVCHDVREGVMS